MNQNNRLVYSTGRGSVCPECGHNKNECRCKKENRIPRDDGVVRIRRETKGRKGKTVTAIYGIALPGDALTKLASELKRQCGTGGSAKDGVILIQGDHRQSVKKRLEEKGYSVKLAGG